MDFINFLFFKFSVKDIDVKSIQNHSSPFLKCQNTEVALSINLSLIHLLHLKYKSRRYLHFLQEIITEYVLVTWAYCKFTVCKTSFETRLVPFASVEENWKFPSLSFHFPFFSYQSDLSLDKMELIINTLLDNV